MAGERPLFMGLESPAIARIELLTSAGVVTFDVAGRDFPGNRSPPRRKFMSRQKENSAP
jgi:hypothetical protein